MRQLNVENYPGTFPKQQIRNPRNVDPEHFIDGYLKNDHDKRVEYNLKLRNPLFVDFNYQNPQNNQLQNSITMPDNLLKTKQGNPQKYFDNQQINQKPPSNNNKSSSSISNFQIGRNGFTNFFDILPLPSPPPQYEEDKIYKAQITPSYSINSKHLQPDITKIQEPHIQQIITIEQKNVVQEDFNPRNLRISIRKKNKEKFSVLPLGEQFKDNRSSSYLVDPQIVATQLNQYQPQVRNQLKDKYIRRDMINHQILPEYVPRFQVDAGVDKYDRPLFKDYSLNQYSAAQVIRAKNDPHGKYEY